MPALAIQQTWRKREKYRSDQIIAWESHMLAGPGENGYGHATEQTFVLRGSARSIPARESQPLKPHTHVDGDSDGRWRR